jgi:hypothetical protein
VVAVRTLKARLPSPCGIPAIGGRVDRQPPEDGPLQVRAVEEDQCLLDSVVLQSPDELRSRVGRARCHLDV